MSWTPLVKSWHDTSVDYCDVCGNLLINRYWDYVTADGRHLRVCREDDVALETWLREQRLTNPAPWEATNVV